MSVFVRYFYDREIERKTGKRRRKTGKKGDENVQRPLSHFGRVENFQHLRYVVDTYLGA